MDILAEQKELGRYSDNGGKEWLATVPEHWQVSKLKFLGYTYSGINGKKGDDFTKEYNKGFKPFIPFTNICNNLTINENQYQYVRINNRENQNIVKQNDILFLMSSETIEDLAKCSIYLGNASELYLNSFCKGFRINKKNIYPRYIAYLLSSSTYRSYFSLVGRGFTRINLKQEYINDAIVVIPPLVEQIAITKLLDQKIELIDLATTKKKKQIELLKERKQVLIHKAVTRGLNSEVPLKDSKVEWIGEIPEHWKVERNFSLFQETNNAGNSSLPILSVSIHTAVSSEELSDDKNLRGKIRIEDKSSYKLANPGDIAYNMMRAWQGAIGAVSRKGMVSPAYIVAQTIGPIHAVFFEYQYRTPIFIQQIDRFSKGITDFRKRLYWNEFKHLKTIIPPLEEQLNIIDFIETSSNKIDKAISCKQNEIEKLKEYKSTLINSLVIGKIRVG